MNPPIVHSFRQSRRIAAVQTPVIPTIAALIEQNPGTISLGQGVVHYAPPPQCAEWIDRFWRDAQNHKYKPVIGIPPLLDAFAKKFETENQIDLADRAIVITAGANMAFLAAVLAIADPGDEIILPAPFYFNHEMAIAMANCRPVLVPTDQVCQLDLVAIERAITDRTRAIVTVSPNNPTGAVYPREDLTELNELCRRKGLYHISDEAYEYFTFDGASHYSPASAPGSVAHTISLFSLSKAYGFASWRIGAMIIPATLLPSIKKVQDTNVICPPVISQFAACGALDAGKSFCKPHLDTMGSVRREAAAALTTLDGVQVAPTSGALYLWLKIASSKPAVQLAAELISHFKIATIPGIAFGPAYANCLRVSIGALDAPTVRDGLTRLTTGLSQLR